MQKCTRAAHAIVCHTCTQIDATKYHTGIFVTESEGDKIDRARESVREPQNEPQNQIE